MHFNTALGTLAAASILALGATAQADINEVVEGDYDAQCQRVTLSAGIFETACESDPNSLICSADWVGQPFSISLPCGEGQLTGDEGLANDLQEQCLAQSQFLVTDSDGQTMDVTPVICAAARSAVASAGGFLETTANGTYSIDVGSSTWFSNMDGVFSTATGESVSLNYLTANFPWSGTFGFGMVNAVAAPVNLVDVCEGGAGALTMTSGGSVDKSTGELSLDYNLNGSIICPIGASSLTVTVNLNADIDGARQ